MSHTVHYVEIRVGCFCGHTSLSTEVSPHKFTLKIQGALQPILFFTIQDSQPEQQLFAYVSLKVT